MAIAEDVRNLFREFDGRAESYVEFVPGVSTRPVNGHSTTAGAGVPPVHEAGTGMAPAPAHPTPPPDHGRLDAVFARLAGRSG